MVDWRQIDARDDTHRISTAPVDETLRASIHDLGLLQPLILVGQRPPYRIVSGYRRYVACRELGHASLPARIVSGNDAERRCARIAISDNALQRPLNLVETARALNLLGRFWLEPAELMAVARDCGLAVGRELLARLSAVTALPAAIQRGLVEGWLALPTALELGALAPPEQAPLVALLRRLRVSTNKQRELLTHLRETARREGVTPSALLAQPALHAICHDPQLDRNQQGARLRQLLWQRRYPAYAAARQEFAERLNALALAHGLQLDAPPYFESSELTLTLRFRDAAGLQRLAQALERLLNHPAFPALVSCTTLPEA
jgi:ParB family chromosome partitioning protein